MGEDELSQGLGEEESPEEAEQVVPLHPGGVVGLDVLGELAIDALKGGNECLRY